MTDSASRRVKPVVLVVAAALACLAITGLAGWLRPTGHPDPGASPQRRSSEHPSTTPTARPTATATRPALPAHVLLQVPAISQLPELPNGCEITSLAMLLSAVGHPVDKMTLARQMPKDPTPVVFSPGSDDRQFDQVVRWGDPQRGFVGDVYGQPGYAIYHTPLARFLDSLLPGRADDLTGQPFTALLRRLAAGVPVVVWDTSTFRPTDHWTTWSSPDGPVRATQYEHAVLLVGYDATHVYVDNPLNGHTAQPVDRAAFVAAWHQLGDQALTVAPR